MPTYLIILLTILICIAIVVAIYLLIAFRKIGIVAKKIDYLVEDLTYKSEMLTPVVESLNKISNYVDLFEGIIKQNTDSLIKFISHNKESAYKFANDLKDLIKDKK